MRLDAAYQMPAEEVAILRRRVARELGLLVALVSWLALLFATIGLFAARNATAYAVLCLCALSMSSAVFMVSELNQPIDGIIKVSRGPLTEALNVIGQAGIHASAHPAGADHATSIGPS